MSKPQTWGPAKQGRTVAINREVRLRDGSTYPAGTQFIFDRRTCYGLVLNFADGKLAVRGLSPACVDLVEP